MTACSSPLVIDVTSVYRANSWTYALIVFNILIWVLMVLAVYPAFNILPETGAVLREFIATVVN